MRFYPVISRATCIERIHVCQKATQKTHTTENIFVLRRKSMSKIKEFSFYIQNGVVILSIPTIFFYQLLLIRKNSFLKSTHSFIQCKLQEPFFMVMSKLGDLKRHSY